MVVTYRKRGPTPSSAVRDPGAELVDFQSIAAAGAAATLNQVDQEQIEANRAFTEGMAARGPAQVAPLQPSNVMMPGAPSFLANPPTMPGPMPDIDIDLTRFGVGAPPVTSNAAWARLAAMNAQPADDEALVHENAQQEIDRKEADLRQAMLDGDVGRVQDLIAEIAAAKEYMRQSYQDYRNTVNPVYDKSITATSVIQDNLTSPLESIAMAEQGAIQEAFAGAKADIGAEAGLIGADEQARQAAQQIAGELTSMYLETSEGRQDDAQRILQSLETAAFESARAFKVEDLWNIENRERIDMEQRDKTGRAAEDSLEDLQNRQAQLDLDRERMNLAHDETLRRMREAGESPYMDSVGFGQLTAQMSLSDQFRQAGVPLDRQDLLQGVFAAAFDNGVTNSVQMAEWLNQNVSDDLDNPISRFQQMVNPGGLESMAYNPNEINMLVTAMGSYSAGRSQYEGLATMNDAGIVTVGPITEQIQSWKSTVDNGEIPSSMLVSVASEHGATVNLAPFAATAWTSMVEAAAADGVVITPGGSYRTYQTQVDLAEEKGLYSQGGLAATPGTSNHGLGLAVDIHAISPLQSAWLQNNAYKFGWKTIAREPWHWQFYGGSTYGENA